jgi:phosphohistidine phosphatase
MLTLTLLRHAKAESATHDRSDFDRALTDRGRIEAALAGKILAGLALDRALVSAAARTRETWAIASNTLLDPPNAEIDRGLYSCTVPKLIAILRALESHGSSIVIVGHNPIMHGVAAWLAGTDTGPDAILLRQKYPTSALAVFDIDAASWTALGPDRAKLRAFVIPR